MARHALISVILLVSIARIADACVCGSMPPCQRFWTADAVFTGVVTNVTRSDDQKQSLSHTTIVVEAGFRGETGQIVLTADTSSDCHYRFLVGQRYLVYANRTADGALSTSRCSGNKLLAYAEEDLNYAEHLPPPGSGGRIFGRVRRIEQNLLDWRDSREAFPADVRIALRDLSGAVLDLRTDEQGKFEAAGLKPGKYSVSIDAPGTARVRYYPMTIDLQDRACVAVSVDYQSDGRIAGGIVDSSGLPVSRVSISVFPSKFTTKHDYPEVRMLTKATSLDGTYEIGPLPPGDYQVGVNVEMPPRLEAPYPPTYFPGVLSRDQASTITLREGEVRRANFILPRKLTKLSVSGRVVLPDGTPASNVSVNLVVGTATAIASTRTNAAGSFTLTGLSESTYTVRASFYISEGNNGSAQTGISLGDEPVTDLKLILKKR